MKQQRHKINLQGTQANRANISRRLGAAMIEMVLSLPLFFVVFALIFFLGTRMNWVQRQEMMGRYETWRAVHNGTGPRIRNNADAGDLNEAFLLNRAEYVSVNANHRPDDYETMDDFVSVAQESENLVLGDYVADMISRFPGNYRVRLTGENEARLNVFSEFGSSVARGHVRIHQPWWQYWPGRNQPSSGTSPGGSVTNESLIRDHFFEDFDDTLETMENNNNDWARSIRTFYLRRPGYGGPTVWVDPNGG